VATVYDGHRRRGAGEAPKAGPVLDAVAVNGVAIPEAEILAEAQNHPADTPGDALSQAAHALVVRTLLLQEAARLGIEADATAPSGGRAQTPDDAVIAALLPREVAVPTATSEECRRYFDRNPDRFRSEPIHEARHILLAAPAEDGPARKRARSLSEELIVELKRRPDAFETLALVHSDCPSRAQGGALGQLTRGSTVPEFERALARMDSAALFPHPVESRFGFHVVRLDRTVPGRPLPFDAVRDRIAAWLDASAWSKAVSHYVAVLAGRAEIVGIDLDVTEGPLMQ